MAAREPRKVGDVIDAMVNLYSAHRPLTEEREFKLRILVAPKVLLGQRMLEELSVRYLQTPFIDLGDAIKIDYFTVYSAMFSTLNSSPAGEHLNDTDFAEAVMQATSLAITFSVALVEGGLEDIIDLSD